MKPAHLIFVHGISDVVINYDYAKAMKDLILSDLKDSFSSQSVTEEELSRIITFDNVNYSQIGHDEELRVLNAYETDKKRLYNIFDEALDAVGLDEIRKQIITSVSDVLVYESSFWREQIRLLLLEEIDKYIHTNEPVFVIGHSLGSVVAFDTLFHNLNNPVWNAANFKPTSLFTLGSPLALFTLELDDTTGTQKPRYMPGDNPSKTVNLLKPNGCWFNFFDAQDVIAYPLETIFKDKFMVQDVLVQTGTNPIKAHVSYWENKKISKIISECIKESIK